MIHTDLPSAPALHRRPATVGRRVLGAGYDFLVGAAIVVLTGLVWGFHTHDDGAGFIAVPGYVVAIALGLVWLYLTLASARGGTAGMRAAHLRLASTAGSTAGVARIALRSLAVVTAAWLLAQASLWLLVPYVLVSAFGARHQMLHDLIAGTLVVDDRAPRIDPSAHAEPGGAGLAPDEANELLADLARLQRRSRADLRLNSVPLIVLGLLALAGSATALLTDGDLFWVSWLYWVSAAPLGLAVTAWWYRRLRLRDGMGTGETMIVVIALLTLAVAILGAFLPIGGVMTGVGFLAVAVSRRQVVLGVAAVGFGLVMGVEVPLHALSTGITNNFPDVPGYAFIEQYGSSVIGALLGVALLIPGVVALRWERSR